MENFERNGEKNYSLENLVERYICRFEPMLSSQEPLVQRLLSVAIPIGQITFAKSCHNLWWS
jgi:hypothetical protein